MKRKTSSGKKAAFKVILTALALILLICRLTAICHHTPQADDMPPSGDIYIDILDPAGETKKINLEEFIVGVVAAEMPASFDMEALKAQSVAARTYVLAHYPPYGECRHGDAAVCCDSTHCQAYCTDEELRKRWGDRYDHYHSRVTEAVNATAGQMLCYNGKIAQTPFFSTCGGSTESSSDCWSGSDIPYLKAVTCSCCGHSPKAISCKRFSVAEAAGLLHTTTDALYAMNADSFTEGRRVRSLTIDGKSYKGTEIRSILGLNSAAFTWLIMGDDIIFATLGYGHGVGMCQYGADGMGKKGYSWQHILAHYYPGTELKDIRSELGTR